LYKIKKLPTTELFSRHRDDGFYLTYLYTCTVTAAVRGRWKFVTQNRTQMALPATYIMTCLRVWVIYIYILYTVALKNLIYYYIHLQQTDQRRRCDRVLPPLLSPLPVAYNTHPTTSKTSWKGWTVGARERPPTVHPFPDHTNPPLWGGTHCDLPFPAPVICTTIPLPRNSFV